MYTIHREMPHEGGYKRFQVFTSSTRIAVSFCSFWTDQEAKMACHWQQLLRLSTVVKTE
jgi:hypothetical protein